MINNSLPQWGKVRDGAKNGIIKIKTQ